MTRSAPPTEALADLLERLGGITPERLVARPSPGTAGEKDLLRLQRRTGRLYELVEGTLVEKVMGYGEGFLAADIIYLLRRFLEQNDLGDVGGADATMRLLPGLVRIPDVSFVRWEKLPNRERPAEPIPGVVPDLAVEVLSEGNTPGESQRKLKEYFLAGVSLVWFVDPRARTVQVFRSPEESTTFTEADTLDGGQVLPGLALPVLQVFARVPCGEAKKPAPRRRKKR